jgi:hypothetical protein
MTNSRLSHPAAKSSLIRPPEISQFPAPTVEIKGL